MEGEIAMEHRKIEDSVSQIPSSTELFIAETFKYILEQISFQTGDSWKGTFLKICQPFILC